MNSLFLSSFPPPPSFPRKRESRNLLGAALLACLAALAPPLAHAQGSTQTLPEISVSATQEFVVEGEVIKFRLAARRGRPWLPAFGFVDAGAGDGVGELTLRKVAYSDYAPKVRILLEVCRYTTSTWSKKPHSFLALFVHDAQCLH